MKTLWQIFAIARTEFRFGLRRGGPVVTTLLIGLTFGAGLLMNPLDNLSIAKDELRQLLQNTTVIERWAAKGITMDFFHRVAAGSMAGITVTSIPMVWPILLLTSFLLLPAATAASLPADRKFGVAELLHSMPINGEIYLAGKILHEGVFLDAFRVGIPLEMVNFFFKFALLDGMPILGFGLTVGILAGSVFHSRRAAVFPGFLAGILSILLWLAAFGVPAQSIGQMDLPAYYLLQNYHSLALDALARLTESVPYPLLGEGAPVIGIDRVLLMYLILAIILFGLFVLARLWLKHKENF